MNDADGARENALGEVQSDELFVTDLVRDRGFGQDRNADADPDRTFERLDVVELHHLTDLDLAVFEDLVHRLARGNVALEGDAILSGERLDAHTAAAREPVYRIAYDHELVFAKRDDGEV